MDGKVSAVIEEVMREAKRRAGSADRLLAKMDPELRRSDSMISAYIAGDHPPPADVFLEAARVTDVHIDDYLYGASLASELKQMKAELEDLKRQSSGGGPKRR